MKPETPGLVYRMLCLALFPFWILHGIRHGARHRERSYLSMRLRGFPRGPHRSVWVHASSVGEVRAVAPLVKALLESGQEVLMTSFTATGYRAIGETLGDTVARGVIPIDFPSTCAAFFRRHRPRTGLIMETELWPELLYQARRHDTRLLLINGRLSAKSLDRGRFVRAQLKRALSRFERILARSPGDRDALLKLGANAAATSVTGNLKRFRPAARRHPRLVDRDYLLLASSHEGEEQAFLDGRPADLDRLLVIAPRHPERGARIAQQVEQAGLKLAVRSKQQPVTAETAVYLADTLGELGALMAYADIVVMGGSFDDTGGHNLLEPAALGRAIITGPSDAVISEDIDMLGAGHGVIQVADMHDCWQQVTALLLDPDRAKAIGAAALARLEAQPDVIARYREEIEAFL